MSVLFLPSPDDEGAAEGEGTSERVAPSRARGAFLLDRGTRKGISAIRGSRHSDGGETGRARGDGGSCRPRWATLPLPTSPSTALASGGCDAGPPRRVLFSGRGGSELARRRLGICEL